MYALFFTFISGNGSYLNQDLTELQSNKDCHGFFNGPRCINEYSSSPRCAT